MSLRVLVVDDERGVANSLGAYLQDEGMEVICVGSAEEALELICKGGNVDVCIMDLRLPGMDGTAAIRILNRIQPQMRYIIHTGTVGYTVPEDLHAMGIGEDHLFTKPLWDLAPLADTIRSLERRADPSRDA